MATIFIGALVGREFGVQDYMMIGVLSLVASFGTVGLSGSAGLAPIDQPPRSDPTAVLIHGRLSRQTERDRWSAVKAHGWPCHEPGTNISGAGGR